MLYQNPEKYRYFIFKNPGIGIWVQSRYTGIFRYTAGACPGLVTVEFVKTVKTTLIEMPAAIPKLSHCI